MEWPDRIFVVDDDADKVQQVAEALRNLSWVLEDFAYMGEEAKYAEREWARLEEALEENKEASLSEWIPRQLKRLAENNPNRFEGNVKEMVVRSKKDVAEAVEGLSEFGSAIALIDFSFREFASSNAIEDLKERYRGSSEDSSNTYSGVTEEWDVAPLDEGQQPGGVFASKFKPDVGPPVRVMVPATTQMPGALRAMRNRAITEQAAMRGGRANVWKAVLTGFRRWIELHRGNPLGSIWHRTKENEWFQQGGVEVSSENMPHKCPSQEDFPDHKRAVEETIGLDLPESWWENRQSVNYVHESLKHMCGMHYCGSETIHSEYNLTVGSAYLIALLAKRDAGEDRDISDLLVDAEKLAASKPKAAFLSMQDAEVAKTTAKALYYFLRIMFTEDRKHITNEDLSLIKSTTFFPDYNRFSVTLRDWKGEDAASSLSNADREADRTYIHDLDEKDWRDDFSLCLRKLQKCMNTSSKGFGCPGVIVLEDNTLTIASAK